MTILYSKGSGPTYFDIEDCINNFGADEFALPTNINNYHLFHILSGAVGHQVLESEEESQKIKMLCEKKLGEYFSDPSKLEEFSHRWVTKKSPRYPNNRTNIVHFLIGKLNYIEPHQRQYLIDNVITLAEKSGVSLLEKDEYGVSFVAKFFRDFEFPLSEIQHILKAHPALLTDLTEEGSCLFKIALIPYRDPKEIEWLALNLPVEALEVNLQFVQNATIVSSEAVLAILQSRVEKELLKNQIKEVAYKNISSFKI